MPSNAAVIAQPPTEHVTTLVRQVSVLTILPARYVQQRQQQEQQRQQQQFFYPDSQNHQQHYPSQSYQYQSQNGNSQTQNQYQSQQYHQNARINSPSSQSYPTTTTKRATTTRLTTTTTRSFTSHASRVTINRNFQSANREGDEESNTRIYTAPSTATFTRPTFSRPKESMTYENYPSYITPSQAPQSYPYPPKASSTRAPQRVVERVTTQAPEYVSEHVNFEQTSPTNPLLFPDSAQQELEIIDKSRVPDYLNLNKECKLNTLH